MNKLTFKLRKTIMNILYMFLLFAPCFPLLPVGIVIICNGKADDAGLGAALLAIGAIGVVALAIDIYYICKMINVSKCLKENKRNENIRNACAAHEVTVDNWQEKLVRFKSILSEFKVFSVNKGVEILNYTKADYKAAEIIRQKEARQAANKNAKESEAVYDSLFEKQKLDKKAIGKDKYLYTFNELTARYTQRRADRVKARDLSYHYRSQKKNVAVEAAKTEFFAGTAAGIARAYEVQRENEELKKEDEEIKKSYGKLAQDIEKEVDNLGAKIEKMKPAAGNVQGKLIDFTEQQDKFNELEFFDVKCAVNKYGVVEVSALLLVKDRFVLDGNNAILDGVLNVNVYNAIGKRVAFGIYAPYGLGELDLYKAGFKKGNLKVECVPLKKYLSAEGLRVEFTPETLWLIER